MSIEPRELQAQRVRTLSYLQPDNSSCSTAYCLDECNNVLTESAIVSQERNQDSGPQSKARPSHKFEDPNLPANSAGSASINLGERPARTATKANPLVGFSGSKQ
jgi:hypothetical protein